MIDCRRNLEDDLWFFFRRNYLNVLLLFFADGVQGKVVSVFEGDTAKFRCPASLTSSGLASHKGVDWYHNQVEVDPHKDKRIKYSKKK